MPHTPPKPPAPRVPASHVQAATARHAVTQAKPAVKPVAPPRPSPVAPVASPTRPGQPAQAKPGPQAPQPPQAGFRIMTSHNSSGPHQIRIAAAGREIGSLEMLDAGRDAVRVVNLKVDPDQRGQGAGAQLMRAAAAEGMRMGKSRVTLESQDNGSGKLTRWYEGMGFTPRGRSDRGMVVLETSAATLQSRLARKIP
ncbi:MAG TPA: GNAT family N-acetyltransferase [Thermoanaerobaculia bacterium]